MAETIDFVFRDFNTPGLPGSGEYEPEKPRIRRLLRQIQGGSGQSVTTPTLAALEAITPPAETYLGIVLNDPDPTVNGYYFRENGEWVLGRGFPDTFAETALAGSASSQVGVVDAGVNPADVEIFWADVQTENDGPLLLNGLPVLNLAGNPLAAGEWAGVVMFVNRGDHWQLIIDAGAAASAAQSASEASTDADRADLAADRAQNAASAVTSRAWFDYVSTLLADNNDVIGYVGSSADFEVDAGDIIEAQGFRYEVAASGATDAHVETAGGVKLYALVGPDGYINVVALGADKTGAVSSQTAFETAIANFGCVTGDPGTYRVSNTFITGNAKYIDFPGSHQTFIQLDPSFPVVDKTPLFALNPEFDNPENNNYQIDAFRLSGVTIVGNAEIVDGIAVSDVGPGGIDVTWTKDDIEIRDVYFRQMTHCIFKRDSTRADVVHWGLRIKGGGTYQVRNYCHIMPNLGEIDGADFQSSYRGIDVSSDNVGSATVWIRGIRGEVARHIATGDDQFHIRLKSVKSHLYGYFEGGAKSIVIEGNSANSQTVISVSQFSRVNKDGDPDELGVPIHYLANSTGASLVLEGVWGYGSTNMEAFIQLAADSAGTIIWNGQGGSGPNIFRHSDGVISQNPRESLNLDYFNAGRLRGLIRIGADVLTRGKLAAGYGPSFASNAQLKIGGILGQGTGTIGAEFRADSTDPRTMAAFYNSSGSPVGSIGTTGSSTNYNTSSDARLKTHVSHLSGDEAAEILRLIEIHRYTWNDTGSPGQGVFAQELYEIYPDAVTPGHGEPGDEDFVSWSVDYSKLIIVLVAAWQGLDQRISLLEHNNG